MGVPRTTDGEFQQDFKAPYSSDGMVTFARAIRLEKMSTHTNVFEWLTGDKPRSVSYMFDHQEEYQVGQRHSTDD
jgi:NAD(P)H dehydrogenase (quinone)